MINESLHDLIVALSKIEICSQFGNYSYSMGYRCKEYLEKNDPLCIKCKELNDDKKTVG